MFDSFSISHVSEKVKHDHFRSLIVILLISFLPLVLGFLAVSANEGFWLAAVRVFFSGELYFYAMSLCGALYVTSQLNNHESNLGMRMWSGAFVICCSAFMAFYIGQKSLIGIIEPAIHGWTSVLFFLFAVHLYFRVMVLADQPSQTPDEVDRERAAEVTRTVDPTYD